MKQNTITLLLISVLSLSACGSSPEDARKELGKMNIPYSEVSFIESAANGDMMAVKLFLAAGMDVNSEDGAALVYAAQKGRTEIVKALLDADADINKGTPLIAAIQANQFEIVKLLLDKGADVNVGNGETLRSAVARDSINLVKLLLDKGADVNVIGSDQTPVLKEAIRRGQLEIVKLLLDKGAHPNVETPSNWVPLLEAIYKGHAEIVKLLLEHGADVNVIFSNNETALHWAIGNYHPEIAMILLGSKNIHVSDSDLLIASSDGYIEIVRLLLEKGTDVNAKDALGNTALMRAREGTVSDKDVGKGHIEVVKLLLDKGANVNAKNADGLTALMKAEDWGLRKEDDIEIMKLLKNAVAATSGTNIVIPPDPQQPKLPNPLGLKEISPSESEPAVVRETVQVPQQEVKIQTEDQQTIQAPTVSKISAKSPSYNCSQAKTDVEITVCNNPDLTSMDAEMAELYRSHKKGLPSDIAKKLIETQKSWLSTRKLCRANVECLHARYQERIMSLKEYEPYD